MGVARQYCGMLGKQDNCQVAVSISLASDQGSLPVAGQLYLSEDWAADAERRSKADVPEEIRFATKTQIALEQLGELLAEGAHRCCVLADAGYGVVRSLQTAPVPKGARSPRDGVEPSRRFVKLPAGSRGHESVIYGEGRG